MIQNCFNHRINWKPYSIGISSYAHFHWKATSGGIDFSKYNRSNEIKLVVNHYEGHSSISNKQKLFLNMLLYCEKKNLQIFKYLPITILLKYSSENFTFNFNSFETLYNDSKEFIYDYNNVKLTRNNKIKKYSNYFDLFNFYNLKNVGNKSVLFIHPSTYYGKNIWLVKATNLNRGMGIKLCRNFESIKKYIRKVYEGIIVNECSKNAFNKNLQELNLNCNQENVLSDDEQETLKYFSNKNQKDDLYKFYDSNEMSDGENNKIQKFDNSQNFDKHNNEISINENMENNIKTISNIKVVFPVISNSNNKLSNIESTNYIANNTDVILPNLSKTVKNAGSKYKNKNNKSPNHYEKNDLIKDVKENKDNKIKEKNQNINKYNASTVIIQKYVEKPLLYNGRKMDIRMWVLITHKMQVYCFKEGHLKTCSYKYDIDDNNNFVHFTNYSLQKYSTDFGKYEIGNEVTFDTFFRSIENDWKTKNKLNTKENQNISFLNSIRIDIYTKIKEIVKISTKSIKNKINSNERSHCFEIFGYDIMMDEDYNAYLIEINTNPGLEYSSPMMYEYLPRMIEDCLRLTVDEIFDTEFEGGKYYNPFEVKGYSGEENMWDYVCNLNTES